jgi:hypothetical protein
MKITAKEAALKVLKKHREFMKFHEIHPLVEPMVEKGKYDPEALKVRLRELCRDGKVKRDWVPNKNYKHYKIA